MQIRFLSLDQRFLNNSRSKNLGLANSRREKLRNAGIIAQAAIVTTLPQSFIADKGQQLVFLIREAVLEKQKNKSNWATFETRDINRITSFELWNYVQKHKNNKQKMAYLFASYDELSFRLMHAYPYLQKLRFCMVRSA